MQAYQREPTADIEAPVRQFLTLNATRWQYVTGVADETLVDPESWHHDYALLSRPGNDLVQLKLFRDYATNAPCIRACTNTSGPAGCRCWRSGVAAMKSSDRPEPKHSPMTCPTPRSTCSTVGTFCWNPRSMTSPLDPELPRQAAHGAMTGSEVRGDQP